MSDTARAIDEKPTFRADPSLFVQAEASGQSRLDLLVKDMHCAGCLRKVERSLGELEGVTHARANLSTRRVTVRWKPGKTEASDVIGALAGVGFEAIPFDSRMLGLADDRQQRALLKALGVAGFAASNVMLLSVSVWSGLVSDMEPATRAFFYWISALIALPAVAYAGQPFFRSAFAALKRRQMNMDVPIALAVIVATGMSLAQTIMNAEHVYFDASITLLFFLLIGRYLDAQAREKACAAAQNLLGLRAVAATLVEPDGTDRMVPIESLMPGMIVRVAAGERIPADGIVHAGTSDADTSLVTGESLPDAIVAGSPVFAGTVNLTAPVTVLVTARDQDSLLAEIVRLMEAAEQGRAGYMRIADRAARLYAPSVHILGGLTLLVWLVLGAGIWTSLNHTVAVLIVTCPCALGLAVPVVQVVATGRLLRRGILVKSADGLERLAEADTVVFDKTGTLTLGRLELANRAELRDGDLALAASLARASRHPLSQAVVRAAGLSVAHLVEDVREEPGMGLEGLLDGARARLGNREWVGMTGTVDEAHAGSELWFRRGEDVPVRFLFSDTIRSDARETVLRLRDLGFNVVLLSGDRERAVKAVAHELGIVDFEWGAKPDAKIGRLKALTDKGARVLMVGDGLNDAPALRAAHVSMSPASAADISQTAADYVFQGRELAPVIEAIEVARKARRLVFENFGLALAYNAVAIPLAMLGYVTPLIAAVAMSSSSITVTLNSLRLNVKARKPKEARG